MATLLDAEEKFRELAAQVQAFLDGRFGKERVAFALLFFELKENGGSLSESDLAAKDLIAALRFHADSVEAELRLSQKKDDE